MSEGTPSDGQEPISQEDDGSPATAARTAAPDHLGAPSRIARDYIGYVNGLKSGAASMISEQFGSALDLLCDSSEPERPSRLNVFGLEQNDEEVAELRMLYLSHSVRVRNRNFLRAYVKTSTDGEFGPRAKKFIESVNDEKFSLVVKELTCADIYMTAIEQLDAETSPAWLSEFFAGCMASIDFLISGEPAQGLLHRLQTTLISPMSRTATSDLCRLFGFGQIGDKCWDAAYYHLRNSGIIRHNLLQNALTQGIDSIKSELGT